jgi:V8-like Glu-specific endopeptidase
MTGVGTLILAGMFLVDQPSAFSADPEPAAKEKKADPEPAAKQKKIVSTIVSTKKPREASDGTFANGPEYWTKQRRESAAPMEWPAADTNLNAARGLSDDREEPSPLLDQPQGSAPGGAPNRDADLDAQVEFPEEWQLIEEHEENEGTDSPENFDGTGVDQLLPEDGDTAVPLGTGDPAVEFGSQGVYTAYPVNLYTQMWKDAPWRAMGKLYFTNNGGGNSYCTASVVSGNNIIVTAGHCLYTRGRGWNSNFSFVPAERYGAAPYGAFSWSGASVLTGYITNGGRRYDMGLLKLRPNSAGRDVTYYTGWLGRSWNYGYTQSLHSFGYASNISTQYTSACAAESFYSALEGTDVLVKGCDMTYGSSGGPWLRNYRPYGGGYVNGVVSGPPQASGTFGNTYVGPRFSTDTIVALCNAQGC